MPTNYNWLTVEDVNSRIRDEHRNDLRDFDEVTDDGQPQEGISEAIELSCESMAIAKVRSALHNRFNDAALFAATGTDRNALLVLHVLNVFVYLLYRRINPRKIPEVVKEDHDETLAWLDRVAGGKEVPDFPAVEDPTLDVSIPRVGGAYIPKGHYY